MSFFLLLMSLAFIVAGVLEILVPKKNVKFVNDIFKVRDPRLWGLVPLSLGILFLFAASASVISWLIVLLGLVEIAKAVYLFLTSPAKVKTHWWFSLPDNKHRIFGILILVLGVIIFISRI